MPRFLEYGEIIDVVCHRRVGGFEESVESILFLVVFDIGNRAEA